MEDEAMLKEIKKIEIRAFLDIIDNPNATDVELEKVTYQVQALRALEDNDASLRAEIDKALMLVALHGNVWEGNLEELAVSNPHLKPLLCLIARNEKTSTAVQDLLASDSDELVRRSQALSSCPNISLELKEGFIEDPSPLVRSAMARKQGLPVDFYVSLQYDQDESVKTDLKANAYAQKVLAEAGARAE